MPNSQLSRTPKSKGKSRSAGKHPIIEMSNVEFDKFIKKGRITLDADHSDLKVGDIITARFGALWADALVYNLKEKRIFLKRRKK